MIKRALILLSFPAFLWGCQQTVDTERPTVAINSPLEGAIIYTADSIQLAATLIDNSGLLQYKLVLVGIDSLNDIGADSTYSVILVEAVPKESRLYDLSMNIPLPTTTFNGGYRLTLTCVDVEGNEALRDTVSFVIRNSNDFVPPVINAGGPTSDTLGFGQGFSPNGTITDETALTYATIYIGRKNPTKTADTLYWFKFPFIQNNEVSFNSGQSFWQVDSTWAQGAYRVSYTAWDNYSGVSSDIPFYVKY